MPTPLLITFLIVDVLAVVFALVLLARRTAGVFIPVCMILCGLLGTFTLSIAWALS